VEGMAFPLLNSVIQAVSRRNWTMSCGSMQTKADWQNALCAAEPTLKHRTLASLQQGTIPQQFSQSCCTFSCRFSLYGSVNRELGKTSKQHFSHLIDFSSSYNYHRQRDICGG